jgi:hypothetical protein
MATAVGSLDRGRPTLRGYPPPSLSRRGAGARHSGYCKAPVRDGSDMRAGPPWARLRR